MKIIHTSDWHLGHLVEGRFSREKEQEQMLLQMEKLVQEHMPDAFLISGDIFDTAMPPASVQKMLTDALVRIHGANPAIHIYCIAGNHDSGSRHTVFQSAWESLNVHMVGSIYNGSDLGDYIFRQEGVGYFVAVPYASERFMPENIFSELYAMVEEMNRDEQLPVALLAHLAVGRCDVSGHELADDEQVGGIRWMQLDELGGSYDYVALGHIHKRQQLDGDGKVWYSGTPLAVSFDESKPGNSHGVLLVECGAHGTEVKVTPLQISGSRPLVNIPPSGFGKWEDVIDEFRQFPDDIPAYIRLNVEVEDYLVSGATGMAEAVSTGKQCIFCKINSRRREDVVRSGERIFTTAEFKKKDPVEVAQMWFRDVKGWEGFEEKVKMVVETARKSLSSGE